MSQRTVKSCTQCSESFAPVVEKQRFCSKTCRIDARGAEQREATQRKYATQPVRHCNFCQGELTGRQQAACSSFCRRKLDSKARRESGVLKGPKPLKFPFTCVVCDRDGMATRVEATRHAYCARVTATKPGRKLSSSTELVHIPKVFPTRATPLVKGSYWVSGKCTECGSQVTSNEGHRTCSEICNVARLGSKTIRRRKQRQELEAGMKFSKPMRARVANKDGWVCQLCFLPVPQHQVWSGLGNQPLYPTLDHVSPLATGGEHAEANLRLAHFRCNSARGIRIGWKPSTIFMAQMAAALTASM